MGRVRWVKGHKGFQMCCLNGAALCAAQWACLVALCTVTPCAVLFCVGASLCAMHHILAPHSHAHKAFDVSLVSKVSCFSNL